MTFVIVYLLFLCEQVEKCRSVLASHNVGIDDKVAMISDNRVEWAVTFFAANSLGAQIIPMYQVQVTSIAVAVAVAVAATLTTVIMQ